MLMPTAEQIRRGQQVSSEMFDASVSKSLGNRCDATDYEFAEIVDLYLREDIDSVTGIFMAMQVDI